MTVMAMLIVDTFHDSDSYWKFKFRDTNLTDETWQVRTTHEKQACKPQYYASSKLQPTE